MITTIEQSKELIRLGINPDTADAYYQKHYGSKLYWAKIGTTDKKDVIRAWSLGALMQALNTPASFYTINHEGVAYENINAGIHMRKFNKKTNLFENLIDAIRTLGKRNLLNTDIFPRELSTVTTPIFKVGDTIRLRKARSASLRITGINDTCYISGSMPIPIEEQDDWELCH